MEILFGTWSVERKISRAKLASEGGDPNSLSHYLQDGWLDTLPEAEQRRLVADALVNAAKTHNNCTMGKYPDIAYTDQKMAELVATLSQELRARALDIRLNPEGNSLKEQFPWP
jgi:hypothetical protein